MQPLRRKHEIRQLLECDRAWSLYALADLDEPLFSDCQWWRHGGGGLALVYSGISICPIYVQGSADEARHLLENLPVESGYLNLRMEMAEIAGRWAYQRRNTMNRMILADFRLRAGNCIRLTPEDAAEIEALFSTGTGDTGIAFGRSQLDAGFFRGVRDEAGHLIAVAGTHVASVKQSVAGVGNVFVREDRRGHGLAQQVLSAVVEAVRGAGIGTIGLNVGHLNAAAIRAYRNLGFETRFAYYEGPAVRST